MVRFPITDSEMIVRIELPGLRVRYAARVTTVSKLNDQNHWVSYFVPAAEKPFDAVLNELLDER